MSSYYQYKSDYVSEGSDIICRWWRPRRGGKWRPHNKAGALEDRLANRLRPLDEWGEDDGEVLWFRWPIEEPPEVTDPLCNDWPKIGPNGEFHTDWSLSEALEEGDVSRDEYEAFEDYYTHWLPLPDCNALWVDEPVARRMP